MGDLLVDIPDELHRRLRALARRRGLHTPALVRDVLQRYLEEPIAGPGRGTFGEHAADLEGAVDGPPDLSTARRHLRDLGR
jgi:hypothetical protein